MEYKANREWTEQLSYCFKYNRAHGTTASTTTPATYTVQQDEFRHGYVRIAEQRTVDAIFPARWDHTVKPYEIKLHASTLLVDPDE